jgi:intraflagellar transport protein 88
LEESALLSTKPKNDVTTGLSKAKEASILDRQLLKMRDQNGGNFTHNFDLTYSVLFNLANQYARNDMHVEALNTYSLMTKNKMFSNVNRLKINMGNIYFQLGLFTKAIKMYRMALDQVPSNQKELRLKITHNIGILFIKMGQYSDAATSFEFIMSEKGDLNSGLHLILCYYAVGDAEKMKKAFQWLLDVPIDFYDDDKLLNANVNLVNNVETIF